MSRGTVMFMALLCCLVAGAIDPTVPDKITPAAVPVIADGGCVEDGDCAADEYCVKPLGECDGPGKCAAVLEGVSCMALWDPVCGCDGKTYSNWCYAAQAGVSVDYAGMCDDGCLDDDDCGTGEYCAKPPGECDGVGECAEVPVGMACFALWDPVCGCDGKTYSNACYALVAGMSIDYVGECVDGCLDDQECGEDEYCLKPLGDCDGVGECKEIPYDMSCIALWDPVCGCDGKTYSNCCYAMVAGVSVDYLDECEGSCWADQDCGEGEYCLKPLGECYGQGQCTEILDEVDCPAVWDPVCGCDGQTYSNCCYAARAGVSIAYLGECQGR